MALQAKYLAFLADPTADFLASNASINYVPTLTTIAEAAAVVKHLKTQQQVVFKKAEKVLNAFENTDSLCVETDTTLQFLIGGGTYLPGLDDNFLSEKVVNVPIIHIATFDADQKISQIRLHWDQACLLKAVDTIGARGRNWPINSAKDQVRVISTSVGAAPHDNATASDEAGARRSHSRGVDPHATLSLFAPRDPNAYARDDSARNIVAPRPSARPPPREYGELFAGDEARTSPDERSPSPSKLDNALKSGAGKHYKDVRVFDPDPETSKDKGIKTDARKYNHFEFGEAEFTPSPIKNDRTKHMSQWDFSDFTSPQKLKPRATAAHPRNFDINSQSGEEAPKAPVWREHHPHPRRDAKPQFDFAEPAAPEEKPRAIIARTAQSKGLYRDVVLGSGEDETLETSQKQPLANITNTNVNAAAREATFGSHWDPTDQPSPAGNENSIHPRSGKNISEATKRVVKGMEAGWEMTDEASPQQPKGIKILGNGSGSSKAAERSWWDF